jgi:alpha-N-arabinofuranosidase
VIAPILTRKEGILIQSIYYPFVAFSQHARGNALSSKIDVPTLKAGDRGDVPALDASFCHDPASGFVCAFIVNRSIDSAINTEVSITGARFTAVTVAEQLNGDHPKIANSWENPQALKPSRAEAGIGEKGELHIKLPRLGFVCVRATIQ